MKKQIKTVLKAVSSLIEGGLDRARVARTVALKAAEWLKMPWSVQSVVLRDEMEWRTFNRHRKSLALSRIERELLFAGEHPVRFSASLFFLVFTVWTLAQLVPADWLTARWEKWGPAEQLTHFSTLWAVQATLAAMVYPIVIAFVTVFLQRRPAAEAFIHLYMLDSGALAAGLSSVVLVMVMAAQYVLLPSYGAAWLPGWVALDACWFLLNAGLTTYFLFRTVEFLRPEVQKQVIQRYAVTVALPRDVMRLNSFQVFGQAQEHGWVSGPSYFDDTAPDGPKVLLSQFGFRNGAGQGLYSIREPSRLVNVRFLPLRLVTATWMYMARKWPQPQHSQPNRMRDWPLLSLPLTPGQTYSEPPSLATIDSGPQLNFWQRWLLRRAYVFRPLRRERLGIQIKEILDELEADARVAAGHADVEAFERSYETLIDLHKLLLSASLVRAEDGALGSWALLPDVETFADRALHVNWSNSYRSIFQAAIESMTRDTRPVRRLCHLIQHIKGDALNSSPLEIREHILLLPPLMMYQLGGWWARTIAEQGITNHSPQNMVTLRAPLHKVYEEVMVDFVSGWESVRRCIANIPDASQELDWTTVPVLASLNARHIEETARMLLGAIAQGDRTAAEWLADVLAKWWDSLSYENEPHVLYGKTEYITLDHLTLDWDSLAEVIGLTELDLQLYGGSSVIKRAVLIATLGNFWHDIRLLVLELLLFWTERDDSLSLGESTAMDIAAGMLNGNQWRSGGTLSHPLSMFTAPRYLNAKVRQYAADGKWNGGYIARLNHFVERIRDMERPNMVSSRVYSFSGADDVGSLNEQQLVLFSALSSSDWVPNEILRRQIEIWFSHQYGSIEILLQQTSEWLQLLDESAELGEKALPILMPRISKEHTAAQGRARAKHGIESLKKLVELKRADVLAAEPVDPERLSEISHSASSKAFEKATGEFPLQLFTTVQSSPEAQKDFTLRVNQIRKGELTRTEMDQRAVNESDHWAKTMMQQVGAVVFIDVLAACAVRDVFTPSADAYWSALKTESEIILRRGEHPILILDNATRPEWVWEWQYADYGREFARPDDLRVQRHEGRGPSYLCDFNDIQVYVGPLAPGKSILLSREAFKTVTFQQFGQGHFVNTTFAERDDSKLLVDLMLTFSRNVEVGNAEVVALNYTSNQN